MIGHGSAAFATLLLFVVGWLIGVRLLLLASRTRRLPELTIGLNILTIAGLSYPLAGLSTFLRESSPTLAAFCLVASATASHVGVTSLCLFTWKVFRPGSRLARLVVIASAVAIAVGFAGNLYVAVISHATQMADKRAWTLFLMAIATVAFGWSAAESLVYHDKLRRRLALGMADPVVANRFLLWGIWMGSSAVGCVLNTFFALTSPLSVLDPVALLFAGSCGTIGAVVMPLTFMPPAWYVRSIQARHAAAMAR